MKSWQGHVYVRDGIIKLGIITRPSGSGPWFAFLYRVDTDNLALGNGYPTSEDAQRAIEKACED